MSLGLLGTSLPEGFKLAEKAVELYALRMQIDEAFRDPKSTRFGLSLELHRTYQLERLQGGRRRCWSDADRAGDFICVVAVRHAGRRGECTGDSTADPGS